jgi:hypothetical protein
MKYWQLFTQHPASVGETYVEHLCAACKFGLRMVVGGGACFIHAVFPFLCVRTGSNCIAELYSRMSRRGAAMGPRTDIGPAA